MTSLLKRLIPGGRNGIILFGMGTNTLDTVKTPGYEDIEGLPPGGLEGIRRIFMTNKYGELSPELTTMIHMSSLGLLAGSIFGGYLHGRKAWADFMENNQATQFANHLEAKRKLQDTVTYNMGKGALKYGWKIGGFTSLFIASNTVIAAYMGRPGFIEYVGAGFITGGLLKSNLGIKGFISGSLVGAFCGTIAGAASILLLYLSGTSMREIQEHQHKLRKMRRDADREGMQKQFLEDEYRLIKKEAEGFINELDGLTEKNPPPAS